MADCLSRGSVQSFRPRFGDVDVNISVSESLVTPRDGWRAKIFYLGFDVGSRR